MEKIIIFEDATQKEVVTIDKSTFAGMEYVDIQTEAIDQLTGEIQKNDRVSLPVDIFEQIIRIFEQQKES